jgi:hypothetical protein
MSELKIGGSNPAKAWRGDLSGFVGKQVVVEIEIARVKAFYKGRLFGVIPASDPATRAICLEKCVGGNTAKSMRRTLGNGDVVLPMRWVVGIEEPSC